MDGRVNEDTVTAPSDAVKPRGHSVEVAPRSVLHETSLGDSKASSDPNLQLADPKEVSFAFRSAGHGHSGSQTSWGRTTLSKARNLIGRVQRSLSTTTPPRDPHHGAPYIKMPGRHTADGVCMDPLILEDPYEQGPPQHPPHLRSSINTLRSTGSSTSGGRTSRTPSDRSSYRSYRSYNGSLHAADGRLPPGIAEASFEHVGEGGAEEEEEDSFVAIPEVRPHRAPSDSGAFGRIGGSFDQINSEATLVVKALNVCQRFALKPISIILKLIGWRRFRKEGSDLHQPCHIKVCNTLYPLLVFTVLAFALVIQSIMCLSRTEILRKEPNSSTIVCGERGLISTVLVPDCIIVAAYCLGLFVFRFQLPDHYYRVMETVFLSFTWTAGSTKVIKRVVYIIVSYLFIGLFFLILSFCLNLLRLVAIDPLSSNVTFVAVDGTSWTLNFDFTDQQGLLVLPLVAFVGLTIFDIFYLVVIVTYCSECQLLIYYISNVCNRVKDTSVPFDIIIKDINNLREFVRTLNGNFSHVVSLLLFNFLTFTVNIIGRLYVLEAVLVGIDPQQVFPYVLGTLSLFQWIIFFFVPIIQATRLTRAGKKIKSLGLELRARPYVYAETPQLDLDSFQLYCSHVEIKARFAHVPMYPALVVGLLFMGGVVFVALLSLDGDSFPWAPWL